MKIIWTLSLITLLFACNANQDSNQFYTKKELLVDTSSKGFGGDIRLSIVNKEDLHNATKYKVVSTYKNQDIGFGLLIPKSPTSEDGYGEGIIINSLGDTSDNFIRVLSETYKLSKSNLKFTNSVGASFVDLEKFAKKMTSQAEQTNARQLKLFFEGKDDVAEIFLNVNDKEGWVELKEKDEEYRLAIIDILAAK